MSELPKVSVIIATRNRAAHLKRTLDRLFEDDYPNRELVIVDGASTDGTVELLKSCGDKITRWVSEPDDGEYFAYNKALAMSTGDIVKFMTDDDVLRPGALRHAADYFLAHPDVDIVFGQTAFWQGKAGKLEFLCVSEETDTSRLSLRHWLRETQGVSSISGFIRRRVFEKIGFLSTKYVCGDVEFWARAAASGVRMGLMPHAVVDYYMSDISGIRTKWRQIAADMMRINAEYGSYVDVLICFLRKYVRPFTYGPTLDWLRRMCDHLGFHPLRRLRRWLAKVGLQCGRS